MMPPAFSQQDMTTFGAFMYEGMTLNHDRHALARLSVCGHIGLVETMAMYAPTLAAMANDALAAGGDLSGPIEYEACVAFGHWYARHLYEKSGEPTREECINRLRVAVKGYFLQGEVDAAIREQIVKRVDAVKFTSIEELPTNLPTTTVIKTAEDRMSDWLLSNVSNVTDITHEEISAKQIEFLLAEVGELRTAVRTPLLLPLIALNDDVRGHVAWLRDNFCDGEQEMRVADALDALTSSTKEQAKTNEGFVLAFPGASDAEAEELVNTLKHGGNTVVRISNPIVEQAALGVALDDLGLEAGELNSSASLHL